MDMSRDENERGEPRRATPEPTWVGLGDCEADDMASVSGSNSELLAVRRGFPRDHGNFEENSSSGSSEIFQIASSDVGIELESDINSQDRPDQASEESGLAHVDKTEPDERPEPKERDSTTSTSPPPPHIRMSSQTGPVFRAICPNPDCRGRIRLKRTGIHNCPACRCRFQVEERNPIEGELAEAARLPDDDGLLRVHCAHCGHRGKLTPVPGRYVLICKSCGQGTTVRIQNDESVLTDAKHLCPACQVPVRMTVDSRGEMCAFCDNPQCGRDLVVSASSSLRKPTGIRLPASTRVVGNFAIPTGKTPNSASSVSAGSVLSQPPRSLGDFELLRPIGSGGMGEIHQARSRNTNQIVAIKIIRRSKLFSAHRDEFERRFLREIQLMRKLSRRPHPNIASYVADGKEADEIWYAMEFVEGTPLSRILKNRLFSWEEGVWVCGKIADALSHAHANGVLHRDIKDANIIVSERNEIRLVDFGLAKSMDHDVAGLTKPADLPGTIGYLAPELWQGSPHTSASDLYALGVVFLQMVFDPKISRRRDGVTPPPDAVERGWPLPLIQLISSLLAKDPTRRPASASVVRMEFHSILTKFLSPTQAEFEVKPFLS